MDDMPGVFCNTEETYFPNDWNEDEGELPGKLVACPNCGGIDILLCKVVFDK